MTTDSERFSLTGLFVIYTFKKEAMGWSRQTLREGQSVPRIQDLFDLGHGQQSLACSHQDSSHPPHLDHNDHSFTLRFASNITAAI